MRFAKSLILTILFLLALGVSSYSQSKKTIILVRHAEKDASATADPGDPALSAEGAERAKLLVKRIKKYKPGAVFSTDYKRTRETAGPMAARRHKQIEIYDAKKPDELINRIMTSKTKRFLVVGHSNTVPGLANLLLKKKLFQQLDESEFGTIWIIKLRAGKEPRTEVLQY
jgi:broad specificity phosphatase PhoE